MSSIGDILGKKTFDEPPEIQRIKTYVSETFKAKVSVLVGPSKITIQAPNAALASTLQLHRSELIKACRTDKRVVIQIS
jgi:hypothetical protein